MSSRSPTGARTGRPLGGSVRETPADLDRLAHDAAEGDRHALAELCRALQHPLYRLALRMLWNPEDAEDATQEILVRVVTNLGSFEGRSSFMTWAYAVATRQLLRTRRRAAENSVKGAKAFAAVIDAGMGPLPADPAADAQYQELCTEVRISCTHGMLLCLSREVRVAYLLGDLIGMTDREGAEACGISPAAFRQRLARARATMRCIIAGRCGLVREQNPCRCGRQIASGERLGIIDRSNLKFARHPSDPDSLQPDDIEAAARQLDIMQAFAEVFRSEPRMRAPATVYQGLRQMAPDLFG